jgi:hypothetical protein
VLHSLPICWHIYYMHVCTVGMRCSSHVKTADTRLWRGRWVRGTKPCEELAGIVNANMLVALLSVPSVLIPKPRRYLRRTSASDTRLRQINSLQVLNTISLK